MADGLPLGNTLGSKLGLELGTKLGKALGTELGKLLGARLGSKLGITLGKELIPELGASFWGLAGAGIPYSGKLIIATLSKLECSAMVTASISFTKASC